MAESNREHLRVLLHRMEEVRGLSPAAATPATGVPDEPEALVDILDQLVGELELSHRRLIETNVQLVSLREIAGSLANTRDAAEATQVVAGYLRRVLNFDQVGLLLVDRERGVLTGTWAHGHALVPLEIPMVGPAGAMLSSLWQHRAVQHDDPSRHPAVGLPAGHPLARVFAEQVSFACVPLEPASAPQGSDTHPACQNCVVGRTALLVPPPGTDTAAWRSEHEDRQQHCLRCPNLPLLGLIAAARGPQTPTPPAGEYARLESVAFALAPMVENARLVHDLSRNRRFLANVLDSMPSALVAFGPEGRTLSLNRTAQDLLGCREADAVGLPMAELLGSEGEALVAATLASGHGVQRQETTLRTPGGTALPVRMTTSRLRDEHGRAYGAIATFLDLTPLRAAEERARQLDRLAALGRFTSSVAHEIRNPLTGIGMGVRRLSKALANQPDEAEHVEFVVNEIRRLDRIVQELFDVTHPRRLDRAPRPLDETLRRAEQSLAGVFEERRVTLSSASESGLPDVPHDADQMQQVFINLFKNAAEASPPGAIIHVRVTRGTAPERSLVVSVRDEGCGMNVETQNTLFEPFFTTKLKGTGLGLYITHDIVERHGGRLTVLSDHGRGATFTVELPLAPQGGTR
jgi:PAS domain S-box-containing protein